MSGSILRIFGLITSTKFPPLNHQNAKIKGKTCEDFRMCVFSHVKIFSHLWKNTVSSFKSSNAKIRGKHARIFGCAFFRIFIYFEIGENCILGGPLAVIRGKMASWAVEAI